MSENMGLMIYRDWKGLNMSNSWWKDHDSATMYHIEHYYPWLHFLDLDTNPTIQNTYAEDAGIDGSRFEYNVLAKTPITLNFFFEFDDFKDFIDKKHDVQEYFAAKAGFILATDYHPNVHACGYVSKVDIKPTSDNISVFSVTMDNALGMWYTNSTGFLEKNWNDQVLSDLRLPTSMGDRPNWNLKPGVNEIFIAGDVMSQLTNPIMDCRITLNGCSGHVKLYNKTSNTTLEAKGDEVNGTITWNNLDLRNSDGKPINQCSNSLDLWLDPGWNEIELSGCSGGYIDTRFYFTNL